MNNLWIACVAGGLCGDEGEGCGVSSAKIQYGGQTDEDRQLRMHAILWTASIIHVLRHKLTLYWLFLAWNFREFSKNIDQGLVAATNNFGRILFLLHELNFGWEGLT